MFQVVIRLLGMDESLFKRLERKSEAVVQLNVQYRMNRWVILPNKIMSTISNIYFSINLFFYCLSIFLNGYCFLSSHPTFLHKFHGGLHSKIMALSNTLMYGGRLECGSERTASAMLTLPSQGSVQRELELSLGRPEDLAWVQAALEPLNPVCFLDTTQVSLLRQYYSYNTLYFDCYILHDATNLNKHLSAACLTCVYVCNGVGPLYVI
jgi:DNA replication ATP-dependent helicase Dna2